MILDDSAVDKEHQIHTDECLPHMLHEPGGEGFGGVGLVPGVVVGVFELCVGGVGVEFLEGLVEGS